MVRSLGYVLNARHMMKKKTRVLVTTAVVVCCLAAVMETSYAAEIGNHPSPDEIMASLMLDNGGKTEVVKRFPDSFPEVLTARGKPIIYTRENSKNFEYIGMPIGGLCAGQLYLGGDGKLWFWDIFNLNYKIGHLKGVDAYQYPYERSKPNEKGALAIEQGFAVSVVTDKGKITKTLDRDGIRDIAFLGQYPIGEVTYRDPELPVEVRLEAFSPFIPLDLDDSSLPATVLCYTVENTSADKVAVELSGWMENAVLIGSRKRGLEGTLRNHVEPLENGGLRLVCTAEAAKADSSATRRDDIVLEDFEKGFVNWTIQGDAFTGDGVPNYHQQPLRGYHGKRLADSMYGNTASRVSDRATGKLTSQPFTIDRKYLSLLIGGGNHPGKTCVNVLVEGRIVAAATGRNSETLAPAVLDLSRYQGKQAVIEIVDAETGGWGHVLVDDIVLTDRPTQPVDLESLPDFGTMTLAVLGGPGETFALPGEDTECSLSATEPFVGKLGRRVSLDPGEKRQVTFLLTWHFPTTLVLQGKPETRYYAKRFVDAAAVSDFVIDRFEELASTTRLWRKTWYDSTLPYWFLDRTFLNTSILASSTSTLFRDRLFYGTEGGNQGPGTCTHVWGYVQAMGRLFPDLEKSLREQVDFRHRKDGGAMDDDGIINFRWFTGGLAVDGQSGVILRTYLCHQMSPDDSWLKRVYPGVKRAMQGLTQARDADHDGILTGPQHNTLDAAWYGKVTWLSLHYTAALRATAEMADEVGDHEYAAFCRQTADKGREYIENHLFNGEYFFHEADPEHPESPGIYNGCEYSQLFGQSWAYQVGLGQILDPVKVRTALESLWRYNFSTDVGPFREAHPAGRWFAMPGEGGLIACTWPRGGSEVLKKGNPHFAAYNNECQNGYEYAATSLMMWHGMPYHSLAHVWYMHNDRYHGSKRNPWCEIEWGIHYSRSMAGYGHFIAACGFEYHGPKGYMAFSPRIRPEDFKAAFTAAEGWGTYRQLWTESKGMCTVAPLWGKLRLKTFAVDVAEGVEADRAEVTLAGRTLPHAVTQEGRRVVITLDQPVIVQTGETFDVVLHW
ncbi:hypothetical protein JCM19992_26900 [Thermostilla marina]